ncbi:hypothetical protein OS493_018823 [Desmophyllum pertusum]|uniref:Uncharacterized protein n=1 Tax=Desmophyllum pertusum TaxID=174260 RepID=A0A9W9ZF64_9CNID|nr:hypothetical protein OS493_018823 [Desmophyllum pertusum]
MPRKQIQISIDLVEAALAHRQFLQLVDELQACMPDHMSRMLSGDMSCSGFHSLPSPALRKSQPHSTLLGCGMSTCCRPSTMKWTAMKLSPLWWIIRF